MTLGARHHQGSAIAAVLCVALTATPVLADTPESPEPPGAVKAGASPGLGEAATPAEGSTSPGARQLGSIVFPNSGSKEAQEPFLRGVLLLHSFEYADAREAFQEAAKIDPGFAMAAWGEAMTYNHPLWREVDLDAARKALEKLAPAAEARRAKAPTEREKDFLAAVEALYGEGDKLHRDLAYEEAMRRIAERYPEDLESRSFHALAILGTAQGQRDFAVYMKAGAVAEEVYRVSPEHPGALHYLIHSYDDPVHAPLGLRAARVYARVAPAASHAQHMISHIYVALGAWDETVDANEKSFAVSEERLKRKGLPLHRRNHHALHWLQYAYLQQGRYNEAWEMLGKMDVDAAADPSSDSLWYHAMMRAGWLVESRRFDRVPETRSTAGVALSAVASGAFATGYAALQGGDVDAARAALEEMRSRLAGAPGEAEGHAGCATPLNNPADAQAGRVLEKELDGLISWAEGRRDEGLALVKQATLLEEAMAYEFGPPIVVKPSHELLGELLLEAGRPAEALAAFDASLKRAPRRTLSLLGRARAAGALGETMVAMETWDTLGTIWRRADDDLPELKDLQRRIDQARRDSGGTGL